MGKRKSNKKSKSKKSKRVVNTTKTSRNNGQSGRQTKRANATNATNATKKEQKNSSQSGRQNKQANATTTPKKEQKNNSQSGRQTKQSNATTATKKEQNNAQSNRQNPIRTKDGKVPQGRTLTTHDNFLGDGKKTGSTKKRPIVVIEANSRNELAVVPLSSSEGQNRTRLKKYEDKLNAGKKDEEKKKSFFKHFLEIKDDEGNPIIINDKFHENSPDLDVSSSDINIIKDKIFYHSKPMKENQKKLEEFRKE